MQPRTWHIVIPVRPKAVQSVRSGGRHFHADPKVIKWKNAIRPYIEQACAGLPPSKLPIRVVALRYYYHLPTTAKKAAREHLQAGGIIPYLAPADITDNLNKGVIDVCKGFVFEDDAQIWMIDGVITKQYAFEDRIELEFEETPGVMLLDGTRAGE